MSETPNKLVFSIPVTVEKVTSRMSDDSLVVTMATQQNIGLEKESFLLSCRKKLMYMFMSEAELEDEGVLDAMPDPVTKPKAGSPAQKLRNALFSYHAAQGKDKEDFDEFYKKIMGDLAEHYKNKAKELNT